MNETKDKEIRVAIAAFSAPPTPKELEGLSLNSHESIKLKVSDKNSGKDRMVNFDYEGLMTEAHRREDSGDLQGAFEMLDIAERLVHDLDDEQSEKVTREMAETLYNISDNDNSAETNQARLARLDYASGWLSVSDDYKKLNKLANRPEKFTKTIRRGFRLGATAVFNTFKRL